MTFYIADLSIQHSTIGSSHVNFNSFDTTTSTTQQQHPMITTKSSAQNNNALAGLSCDAYGGPPQDVAQEMVYWQDIPSDRYV